MDDTLSHRGVAGDENGPSDLMESAIRVDTAIQKTDEADIANCGDHLEEMVKIRTKNFQAGELRYREMVENMPELVCCFFPHGAITFANRACRSQMGDDANDVYGKNFFEWISPNGADLAKKEVKAATKKASFLLSDKRMCRPDGSICWIHWSCHGLFDDDGSLIEYQAVGRDITEERKRQNENAEQDKWRRRTQKLEAIGTLSAGIAHDFNNIVAVILGNVQLAMDDVSKGTRTRKNLDEIYDSCLRARDIVKQILTFSREGDQELRPISLVPVVKESIKFLRSTIPSTLEIRDNIQDIDFVNADPTQIGQVIMNFGTNAAHAMGNGPGVIEISLENITIGHEHEDRFRISNDGKYVKLTVRDTGHGMSSAVMSRVFDPYFTTKNEGEGSGMGLAVVHGIVESHGGTLWVDSESGKGSTFHVLFPAVETEFVPEIESPGVILTGNERILVVDDEKALLEAEMDILERLGYEVLGTTSAVEALKMFQEHPDSFDLVYTDMTMPDMTGLTLAKNIMEVRPDLPVILYSGHRGLAENNEIGKSGIKAFLTKPIILEELAGTIRAVLGDKKRK